MRELSGKRYWLIGASEGLGRSLAERMAAAGARLILSARSEDKLRVLADRLGARALPFDVTDTEQTAQAAKAAGHIDGIIYIAGAYEPMTAQDWDVESALQMADVNFLGALRVLGHVVPEMAQRGHGHIVLIGSLAGHRGLPGAIGYGASKAALMHLGENILADCKGSDVDVQLINPGFIRTRLTNKNDFKMPQIMSPEQAAEHAMRALRGRRFETNFPRPFSWVFLLGKRLPRTVFLQLF